MWGDTLTRRKRGQEHCPQGMEPKAKGLMTKEGWVLLTQSTGSGICPLSNYYLSSPPKVDSRQGHQNPPQGLPAMTSKVLHVREPGNVAERSPEMPLSSQHP